MNRYALRSAALSLLAVALVVAVALTAPSGSHASGGRVGSAIGAVAAQGLHRGAAVRAGPPVFAGVLSGRPALAGAARAPEGRFRAPVAPPLRVTRRFDGPLRPWLPGHRGVDLASAPGATVWAAGPGEVVFAGPVAGRSVVSIQHAGGLRTTYEPLTPAVRRGDQVATGDPIGMVAPGHPGCPVAACLHWGLLRGAEYLDPLLLLGFRVRLFPL